MKSLENTCHTYLSASAVVIHYEEALYQVYAPLHLPLNKVTSPNSFSFEARTTAGGEN